MVAARAISISLFGFLCCSAADDAMEILPENSVFYVILSASYKESRAPRPIKKGVGSATRHKFAISGSGIQYSRMRRHSNSHDQTICMIIRCIMGSALKALALSGNEFLRPGLYFGVEFSQIRKQ